MGTLPFSPIVPGIQSGFEAYYLDPVIPILHWKEAGLSTQ